MSAKAVHYKRYLDITITMWTRLRGSLNLKRMFSLLYRYVDQLLSIIEYSLSVNSMNVKSYQVVWYDDVFLYLIEWAQYNWVYVIQLLTYIFYLENNTVKFLGRNMIGTMKKDFLGVSTGSSLMPNCNDYKWLQLCGNILLTTST